MRRSALVSAAVLLALGIAAPAIAATTTGIGAFTPLTGSSTSYSTTMQLPATGFPEASVVSTSRSGQVGVQTGATNWFGPNTPVGLEYGSSENQPYLNLRPKIDSPTGASLTTYTFERGTPTGWSFVLGDIDADAVTVAATKVDGNPANAAELGFQDEFNICETTPRPSACSGVVAPFDLPTWDSGTRTLTGNVGAADTVGAAGWFEPTVSLKSLSFTFQRRSGFPVFQTWFAVKMQDVTGTVTAAGTCVLAGMDVRLLGGAGNAVASTQTAADGTYAFPGVAASDGYSVEISNLPDGCVADGSIRSTIDLTSGDDTADFTIREIVPIPISGTVEDDHGDPMANLTVSIDDGTNPVRTVQTDSNGYYLFDTNPAETYTLSVTLPAGYAIDTAPGPVVVGPSDTEPVTNRDFVLDADPSLSGTVSDSGGGVGGISVVLLDGGTEVARTTTAADGSYSFDLVASGDYTVAVDDPPGNYVAPTPEPASVGSDDVTDVDLFLARPGSIAGTVTKDGAPVADAVVTITGEGGFSEDRTTDAEGNYAIEGLDAGETYTSTLTPPDGTTIDDPSQEVVIPPGGGDVGDVNFAIEDADVVDPGTPGDSDGDGADDGDRLPDTGGPSTLVGPLGLALLVGGLALVHVTRVRGQHRG